MAKVKAEPPAVNRDPAGSTPFRVMIVDDSAVIRGLVARWLKSDPLIEIVASAFNGNVALDVMERAAPEVVVLDIEMPGMDGMTLLPKLLERDPTLKVIMSSTLTRQNATVSLRALSMGAADYIPKPTSREELRNSIDFQSDLIRKVKALGTTRREQVKEPQPVARSARATGSAHRSPTPCKITLRKPGSIQPQVLAIGSSTGGPQALFDLFKVVKNSIRLPTFITQHMPPMFTTILAENISRLSGAVCTEPDDGTAVEPNHIYVAPGDYHMLVEARKGAKVIRLTQDPPEHFCRPSVNPMFRSLVDTYRGGVLGIMLTGMGSDGLKGARVLVDGGGTLIAQDEATSVVWGMPGAVAKDGLCSSVLPLDRIGPAITKLISGGRA